MSTRLETLQVARLAPQLLGDSTDLVRDFLRGCVAEDGGFRGRDGQGDLYYTVFGLDALAAVEGLGEGFDPRPVASFLDRFGNGESLDLIHLGALARSWAALPDHHNPYRQAMLARLETFRHGPGHWCLTPVPSQQDEQAEQSRQTHPAASVYAAFIALGAHQDLDAPFPDPQACRDLLDRSAQADGGYSLEPSEEVAETGNAGTAVPGTSVPGAAVPATTPTTVAAVVLARHLGHPVHRRSARWLRRQQHRQGGFLAATGAPMPDLLSTAVALHGLSVLDAPADDHREATLDFVDTLWTSRGAFHGHWADDEVDCEYTYYGLLALGHLSVLSSS